MKLFFSGVGGSGMSAIAAFQRDKGHTVSGSDRAFDANPKHPVCLMLKEKGITIVPQDGSGLDNSFDTAIFSTAVEADRPEALKARSLDIEAITRPAYLSRIVSEYRTVAVAGTSGKSTTSGMLAFLMEKLGLRPNFIGGGRVKQFNKPGNSLPGDSKYLVIEACESDGTIVDYRPERSIILNLDFDHHPVRETARMFHALSANSARGVIVNADDQELERISFRNAVYFGLSGGSGPCRPKYKAENIIERGLETEFTLNGVKMIVKLPGIYNLYNALACIAYLGETGVPLQDIAGVLAGFKGIERRFDIHIQTAEHLVIDDYAHNPHKIESLMRAARQLRSDFCYIFQPHGFGPAKMLKDGYIEVFSRNLRAEDSLIILPIFYAGGTVSREISSEDIASGIKAPHVECAGREAVISRIHEWRNFIVLGARDESLTEFAEEIAKRLLHI